MAKLPILQYPHPILLQKAEPITRFNEELAQLAQDMAETMYASEGVGLAANQVGILKRIVTIDVTQDPQDLHVLINPVIIERSEECSIHEEGCLSLKGLFENVQRSNTVTVRAQNIKGERFTLHADGLLAICIQHELDHLDGHVFIDHLSMMKKNRAIQKLQKIRRNEKKETQE